MNAAEQFVRDFVEGRLGPKVVPAMAIQTYLGGCDPKLEADAHRQLTILKMYLDTRILPIGLDKATVSLCKQVAERMVSRGDWSESAMGEFVRLPPGASVIQ